MALLPLVSARAAHPASTDPPGSGPSYLLSGVIVSTLTADLNGPTSEWAKALKSYFGEHYDPTLADWVVYIDTAGFARESLIGDPNTFLSLSPRPGPVRELDGDSHVWTLVFSKLPLSIPITTGTAAASSPLKLSSTAPSGQSSCTASTAKSSCTAASEKPKCVVSEGESHCTGSAAPPATAAEPKVAIPTTTLYNSPVATVTVKLEQLEYHMGPSEKLFDAITRMLPTKAITAAPETTGESVKDQSAVIHLYRIDSTGAPGDELYVGMARLPLKAATKNRLSLYPYPKGTRLFANTELRAVHTTFGNAERGRTGASLTVGTTFGGRSKDTTKVNPYDSNLFLLGHYYLVKPSQIWKRQPTFSLVGGTNIMGTILDEFIIGICIGHIAGKGGAVLGANARLLEKTRDISTVKKVWEPRLFFGLSYSL